MGEKITISIEVDKNYYEFAKKVADLTGVSLDAVINAKIHELALGRHMNFYVPSSISVSTAKELGIEELAGALDDRFEANLKKYEARLDHAGEPDDYGEY